MRLLLMVREISRSLRALLAIPFLLGAVAVTAVVVLLGFIVSFLLETAVDILGPYKPEGKHWHGLRRAVMWGKGQCSICKDTLACLTKLTESVSDEQGSQIFQLLEPKQVALIAELGDIYLRERKKA